MDDQDGGWVSVSSGTGSYGQSRTNGRKSGIVVVVRLLWSPYVIGKTIIFFCPVISFYLSSSFFIPRLISAAADWMSTIH